MEIQRRIDNVFDMLTEFSNKYGENPIEYQNEAVPSVKRMCDWFITAGTLTENDKRTLIKEKAEQFQFFNEENPITYEESEDFSYSIMSTMIGTNKRDYEQFVRVFSMEL